MKKAEKVLKTHRFQTVSGGGTLSSILDNDYENCGKTKVFLTLSFLLGEYHE